MVGQLSGASPVSPKMFKCTYYNMSTVAVRVAVLLMRDATAR
jgi:hypothetical protein